MTFVEVEKRDPYALRLLYDKLISDTTSFVYRFEDVAFVESLKFIEHRIAVHIKWEGPKLICLGIYTNKQKTDTLTRVTPYQTFDCYAFSHLFNRCDCQYNLKDSVEWGIHKGLNRTSFKVLQRHLGCDATMLINYYSVMLKSDVMFIKNFMDSIFVDFDSIEDDSTALQIISEVSWLQVIKVDYCNHYTHMKPAGPEKDFMAYQRRHFQVLGNIMYKVDIKYVMQLGSGYCKFCGRYECSHPLPTYNGFVYFSYHLFSTVVKSIFNYNWNIASQMNAVAYGATIQGLNYNTGMTHDMNNAPNDVLRAKLMKKYPEIFEVFEQNIAFQRTLRTGADNKRKKVRIEYENDSFTENKLFPPCINTIMDSHVVHDLRIPLLAFLLATVNEEDARVIWDQLFGDNPNDNYDTYFENAYQREVLKSWNCVTYIRKGICPIDNENKDIEEIVGIDEHVNTISNERMLNVNRKCTSHMKKVIPNATIYGITSPVEYFYHALECSKK